MDVNSDFQRKMVEYLESLCVGEFLTGEKIDVSKKVHNASGMPKYCDPTLTLPKPPPSPCDENCVKCSCSENHTSWWQNFKDTVDDLLL